MNNSVAGDDGVWLRNSDSVDGDSGVMGCLQKKRGAGLIGLNTIDSEAVSSKSFQDGDSTQEISEGVSPGDGVTVDEVSSVVGRILSYGQAPDIVSWCEDGERTNASQSRATKGVFQAFLNVGGVGAAGVGDSAG